MLQVLYDKSRPERNSMHLKDIPGAAVLKVVEEPSFDNVANLCQPMTHTRTIIGLKEYPFAVGVDWDGTINRAGYGYFDSFDLVPKADRDRLDILYFRIGEPARLIRDFGWEHVHRKLLSGYLPVVTTWTTCKGIEYSITCFAHSKKMASTEDMSVMIQCEAVNTGRKKTGYRIEFRADPEKRRVLWKTVSGELNPGESKTASFRLTYENSRRERTDNNYWASGGIKYRLSVCSGDDYASCLKECTGFWEKVLARGMRIEVPEERVRNAYRAWLVYNFLNVRRITKNGRKICVPHDGSGFYGEIYGICAATYVQVLLMMNYSREAGEYLRGLLCYQREDGLFLESYGLSDTGNLLLALARYYLFTGDSAGFSEFLPAVRKLTGWIKRNRNLNPGDREKISYGLLPKGKYLCDMKNEDLCYLNDVCCWKGLSEISRVYAELGMKKDASETEKLAATYRKDILSSMKKASFPERELFPEGEYKESSVAWQDRDVYRKGNLNIVPMTPLTHYLERRFGGGYYYAIAAEQILETEFFYPDDALCRTILDFVENRGGVLLGVTRWCDYCGIDHAYSYGHLLTWMKRGNIPAVLLGFYTMLAYGMSRDTFSAEECTDLVSGRGIYGEGTYGEGVYAPGVNLHCQPHNYSNTQQLRLLRTMLVREEGNTLFLSCSVPRGWLSGNGIRISNAATSWGNLSYSIRCTGNEAAAKIEFRPYGTKMPDAIHLKIRHPLKKEMLGVTVGGKKFSGFNAEEETVTLSPHIGVAEIHICYRK